MPVKGNQFKSNSFRDEISPAKRAKLNKERVQAAGKTARVEMPTWDKENGSVDKNSGFAVPFNVDFFSHSLHQSYLFTWQEDQSYISTTLTAAGITWQPAKPYRKLPKRQPADSP
jgi:S-DNA-T family DNA segregation ATPase FtsK/SpoIIIE